jgi:hypothetical protein
MNHPVFGPIEYSSSLPRWEGRVRVPFFSAYDTPAPWPVWNEEELQDQLKEGLFDLFIQDQAGTGPTDAQGRAFAHFQENQDAICAAVVAAIFASYQEQRQAFARGFEGDVSEEFGPALEGAEGLKRLIEFRSLYALEGRGEFGWDEPTPETWAKVKDWALLGFSFRCAWDDEHGLGVLYHRDKVVDVGISDICSEGIGDF